MVDELGKGTSSRDGTALSGALLEHFVEQGVWFVHSRSSLLKQC
jgi:DNA mismatch repair ATPase MutS